MFKFMGVALLASAVGFFSVTSYAQDAGRPVRSAELTPTKELLGDAAIVALIIAGSVAAYKAMGKPCACPTDRASNGSSCGARSAWSRPNGYKPLCFPTDVTASLISAYRATGAIPRP